jgi:hypothetical protein
MGPDNVMLSLGGTDPIKRRIRGWGCSRVVVDWEISDTEGAMFGNRRMESEGLRLRSLAIRAQTLSGGAGVLLWAAGTTGRWRGRTASASDGTLSRRLRLPAAALRGSLCRSAGLRRGRGFGRKRGREGWKSPHGCVRCCRPIWCRGGGGGPSARGPLGPRRSRRRVRRLKIAIRLWKSP